VKITFNTPWIIRKAWFFPQQYDRHVKYHCSNIQYFCIL